MVDFAGNAVAVPLEKRWIWSWDGVWARVRVDTRDDEERREEEEETKESASKRRRATVASWQPPPLRRKPDDVSFCG